MKKNENTSCGSVECTGSSRTIRGGALLLLALTCTAAAVENILWQPINPAPAMGHSFSPATQEVVKGSAFYSLEATVTDLDEFQRATPPYDFQSMAGQENDVIIWKDFVHETPNVSFNVTTGERKHVYTWLGPFDHLSEVPGLIEYRRFKTQGVDTLTTVTRRDEATNVSEAIVVFKYVTAPDPGEGPGGD
jgi:hypothetical protein